MTKLRIFFFICCTFVFVHSAEASPKSKAYASTVIKLSQDRVLFRTIGTGDYEAARRLLAEDANVNAADIYGDSLLAYAVMQGDSSLVRLLIDLGANINSRNNFDITPFVLACMEDNVELLRIFINKGIDINQTFSYGRARHMTPLMMASQLGNFDVVLELIQSGADANLKDSAGKTAYDYAVKNNQSAMAVLLLNYRKE
jgi:ankyrin repeat protein